MKKLIILFVIAFITNITFAQDKNLKDEKGRKQGFWEEREMGKDQYGYYKDGVKDGMWTYMNNRGTVNMVENFTNGKLDGIRLTFEPNYGGSVSKMEQYSNGKLEGRYVEYSYNKIIAEIDYKNDKIDGIKRIYYKTGGNPVLQEESNYITGQLNGSSTWYDDKGELIARYNFKNGKYDGKQYTYYSNGKVESETIYVEDLPTGEYKEYYETGELKKTGQYVEGLEEGNWIEQDKDGKIIETIKYKKGEIKSKR